MVNIYKIIMSYILINVYNMLVLGKHSYYFAG